MTATSRRGVFLALALSQLLLAHALGLMTGAVQPDTGSYLDATKAGQVLSGLRVPLYGLFLPSADLLPDALPWIAAVQWAFHALACLALLEAAAIMGLSVPAAFALAVSALFSQSFFLQARYAIPEMPALSCLILGVAGLVVSAARPRWWPGLLGPIALATVVAVLLRPILLPALVLMPMLLPLLMRAAGGAVSLRRALILATALLLPILSYAAVRKVVVDDFNIVSFGGYQMSGLAGLILDDTVVQRMSGPEREDAAALLALRTEAERAGLVLATPLNSAGERSVTSAALGYFDIYARTYDNVLALSHQLRQPGESWVAFNARLMRLSLAVARAAPERWVAWMAGATTRIVGRAIAANGPMLVALLAAALLCGGAWYRGAPLTSWNGRDAPVLVLIGLFWLATGSALAVVTTFPATRYVESAAMLLPALPLLWSAQALAALRRAAASRATPGAATLPSATLPA